MEILIIIVLIWLCGFLWFENDAMAKEVDNEYLKDRIELNNLLIKNCKKSIEIHTKLMDIDIQIESTEGALSSITESAVLQWKRIIATEKNNIKLIKKETKLLERMLK